MDIGRLPIHIALALSALVMTPHTAAAQANFGLEQILYRFCSQANCADGEQPASALIVDSQGNLYGTTPMGGAFGLGVVFKLTPDGTETVLHSFQGGSDGATPYASLTFDSAGNLLGTTSAGGGSTQCGDNVGCGTVFKIAPDNTETILHAFCMGKRLCSDGISPLASVVLDDAGNIYGTTEYGSIDRHLDNGIVFRLSPDGKEKIVWSFGGGGDAANPMSSVFLDGKFGIIGTTGGGTGAIYRIRPNGFETLIYRFKEFGFGYPPESELTPDGQGHFFGTTANTANSPNPGTVYELTPPHDVTAIHTFGGNSGDGFEGNFGVAYYNGNIYGVFMGGEAGPHEGGIFELSPSGHETILNWFIGSPLGDTPHATPLIYNGYLYGTTVLGGTTGCAGRGCGTVFRFGPLN